MATPNSDPTPVPSPNSGRGANAYLSERSIVITGFMATGKTTVGKRVAEKLGRPFIDTDEEIARRAGKPVAEIFAQDGEAAFRQMERELVQALASQRGLVIATGGGMLVDPLNRERFAAAAFVVCLDVSAEVLQARLSGESGRPLASNWSALLEKRRAAYAAIPAHVEAGDSTPDQVAERIIGLWQTEST